jgi:hypothetical protein
MRALISFCLVATTSAFMVHQVVVPKHGVPRVTPVMGANPFEDAMESFASFFGPKPKSPTSAEIEEYCRDPDSSGCTLEMMDMLRADAAKNTKLPNQPVRWSQEIDDAVFKCD